MISIFPHRARETHRWASVAEVERTSATPASSPLPVIPDWAAPLLARLAKAKRVSRRSQAPLDFSRPAVRQASFRSLVAAGFPEPVASLKVAWGSPERAADFLRLARPAAAGHSALAAAALLPSPAAAELSPPAAAD